MRGSFIWTDFCGNARGRVEKLYAEVLLDNAVDKTRWKLTLFQNVNKLLNVVVEASPGALDFKCSVYQRSR